MISVLDRRWLAFLILTLAYVAEAKWSKWTTYSPCSRSCGVGVKSKERSCLTHRCTGKTVFYKLCNKQDCGLATQDFRAAQCEDFIWVPLDGDYYTWKPYYGHGETCELLCYPEGHEFYHRLAERVVDGTPCAQDKERICVAGVCQPIGCNKQLGSTLRLDACGLCGGDNSTCSHSNTEMGYFQIENLSPGHTTIVDLPVGATDIYIRELGENKNPILLWDSYGDSFALDAETRQSLSRIALAGTKFTYTPHNAGNTEGSLAARGPTKKRVTVYMINEGHNNPGIQYGYTRSAKPHKPSTSSIENPRTVVDSRQLPGITLDNTIDEKIPDEWYIARSHQRTNERYSKLAPNRIIAAGNIRVKSGHEGESYHRSEDLTVDGPRQPLSQMNVSHYLTNHARYMWSSGDWTPCSSGCGEGFQRRGVSCVDRVERQITDSANCDRDHVPASSQSCNNGNCEPESHRSYVSWQPGKWDECSTTCDLGIQSQHVFCEAVLSDGTSMRVNDEVCLNKYKAKPQYRRSCNDDVPCAMWKMSPWSRCSATCGAGRQQRTVACRSRLDSRHRLRDDACDVTLRPTGVRRCDEAACRTHRVTHPPRHTRQCRNSYYGCCPDGVTPARGRRGHGCWPRENVVITEDDSTVKKIGDSSSTDKCYKPPALGGCRNHTVKWYYDHKKAQCDRFWYGGCDGNDNRFETEADCQFDCQRLSTDDTCKLPRFTGRCRARHRRWYHNSIAGECQEFIYGGCDGNANRFRSKQDCERQCVSATEALGDSPCDDSLFGCCPDGVAAAQGNNNEGCLNVCQSTVYGCCDDDITPAQGINQEGCEAIEMGSGDEAPCDQSDYGCCPDGVTAAQGTNDEGCDFVVVDTKPYTATRDPDITVDVSAQCKQASDMGSCRDNPVVMWFYNTTSQRCDRFWYGGCGGNSNRYKSEKECLTFCISSVVIKAPEIPAPTIPACEQPKEIGPCRELLRRWFYNARSRQCEAFQFGGCRGNDNNFESQYTCEYECGVRRGTHISKPGDCPRVYTTDENCATTCHYDGDCNGNEKCCGDSNDCRQCSAPRQEPEVALTPNEVCGLPKEVGACHASMSRWYYSDDTRTCEQFTYGGCGGNRNNFETDETCRRYCRADPSVGMRVRQPVCEMTPALGPCNRAVTKYFYNITTTQCERFTYGGCLGNHNNFETETKCYSYCGLRRADTQRESCTLKKANGGCRGNFRRWFYEPRDGRCHDFSYGGCQGNGNNFKDESSCMAACRDVRMDDTRRVTQAPPVTRAVIRDEDVCSLPLERPCLDNRVGIFWYYDHDIGACREVPNGECNNNRNNFHSQDQCEEYCGRKRVCQPLTYNTNRRCRAAIPRWTYDDQTRRCEQFLYGGCGGSANNFATEDACTEKCGPQPRITPAPEVSSPDEICALSENSGNCLAFIRNWRYDNVDGTCKQFTFGGCGGNKNNFETREKCESFCNRNVVCREATEPEITCMDYMPRWQYDVATAQCENFIYGGCGGNANNFGTFESCERKCIQPENKEKVNRGSTWREICNMQADVGPCKQYLSKWHYNSISQDCEQFTYGGCLGNHNNFESREQCMTYCGDRRTVVDPVEPTDIINHSGEVPDTVTGVAVCHLANVTGPCEAYIRSWYYDHLMGKCAQFIYGGCGGNENRFETRDDCERQCDPREVCLLAQSSGTCLEYNTRYSFNYNTGECDQFVYAGCEGNANNFDSKDSCWQRCGRLARDRQPARPRRCPRINRYRHNGVCLNQCRHDRDCPRHKHCCTVACSRVCLSVTDMGPPSGPKLGFCPPRTDWKGLLGACAPQCHDDSTCLGREKCCHQGCGFRCVEPVSVEPYGMDAPLHIRAQIVTPTRVYVTWSDPSLGRDQLIRDRRFYTVRYYSYSLGQYNYLNATDLRLTIDDLRPETDYKFEVRVNNPPLLSEWSVTITNRTQPQNDGPKTGYCPPRTDWRGLLGACAPQCQDDSGCQGQQKCCHHGCGMACVDPMAMEPYSMDAPLRITIHPMSGREMHVQWYDPDLGHDQRARDRRYYTLRYYSSAEGQYHYMNTTDMQAMVNGLQADTEYRFSVRANNPPYLSHWSEEAENKTIVVVTDGPKTGYCPPRTDWRGLVGACAPQCQDDSGCQGQQKCCHHGCGMACVDPMAMEPYNMDAPLRITIHPMSRRAMHVQWYDPDLGHDQRARDRRYYTLRYYSYAEGQYHYMNTTDMQATVNGLQADTEYRFSVRANNPPYLSHWSEEAENKTIVVVTDKPGSCPRVSPGRLGVCVEECKNDGDCGGAEKCCDNGCGHQCSAPEGYDICNLAQDAGSCGDWEVRWFYNQEIGRCDRFWYGGCNEGNANRFQSENDCQRQCAPIATTTERPVPAPIGPYDCRRSIYGCCPDGYTPARDERMTNCRGIGPDIASTTIVPVVPGESATMTCHGYGSTDDYNVAWYREGKLMKSGTSHTVFPNGTLLVHTATIEDDGSYACHVRGGKENPIVYRFTLQVQVPIGILSGPDMIMVKPNHMAFLHCEVYGNPTPTVSWRKDGRPIQSGGHYETFRNGTLLIRQTAEGDMGAYTCTADNRVSQAVQRSLKLSLREMLVARIENNNGRVTEGGRITLSCEGNGYPHPTISWEKTGRPLTSGGRVFISIEGRLVMRDVTLDDTGTYSCIVANSIEKIETSTSVQVIPKVVIVETCEDRTSTMKCRLIVSARLCSYTMYAKICCHSCNNYFNGDL